MIDLIKKRFTIESGSYYFFQTLLSAKALERAPASNLEGPYLRFCFCVALREIQNKAPIC